MRANAHREGRLSFALRAQPRPGSAEWGRGTGAEHAGGWAPAGQKAKPGQDPLLNNIFAKRGQNPIMCFSFFENMLSTANIVNITLISFPVD
jgi:hypothetical protein